MPKDGNDNRKIVLALRREHDIALFQRFFDRATSGWRYRCTGTCDTGGRRFTDYTGLRSRNPGKVSAALDRLDRLTTRLHEATITAPSSCMAQDEDDRTALNHHADLLRFQAVSTLIVQRHFAAPPDTPLNFRRFPPPYNLIVALDLRPFAERAIARDLPLILEAASAPDFRDDAATNAAGTLRALADMLARSGDDARQLQVLTLSQKLAPNAAKAARIVLLLRAGGDGEAAERQLSQAMLKWPRTPALLALRKKARARQ